METEMEVVLVMGDIANKDKEMTETGQYMDFDSGHYNTKNDATRWRYQRTFVQQSQ